MWSGAPWGSAIGMVVWMGCGGAVEVQSTTGAGGDASGGAGGGTGGATTVTETGTDTGSSTTTSETGSTTIPPEEGCPGLPADAFWVDVQVGGSTYHLTSACPYYGAPYGPSAYAWTNGKSGPEWYFTISACAGVIPEGSQEGPSLSIVASIPDGADLSVPYATVGDIVHMTDGNEQLAPASSPKIVFETFSDPHGLVTGTFAGMVVLPNGEMALLEGQISVCRRDDLIYI